MLDHYYYCEECKLEIMEEPVKGIINGQESLFCSWECFHAYEKEMSYQEGGENL